MGAVTPPHTSLLLLRIYMNLGFDAISQFPIHIVGPDNSVLVSVTKNALTITIGSVGSYSRRCYRRYQA